ncbi:hypothetical protein TW78_21500 [Vibrio coralliilyticus]|uniref:Uncharacterized protein n=1 Tax=Vibrio coralliilyticus TaxID=190893 RepID=A0A837G9H1_9VIBR|nr:hypothetical protein [Vibrio coralliilyticus]KJY68407.1 hypothetical protein TW78_21500 [Vibrio coralliilyticus]QOU30394.1 hypothetical protein TW71_002425 [Vibrio coralliilyticus]
MKAWLYKDFKWWFTGWLALLISALFLYSYNKELGEVLLRFTGTILVALLTAMAAFDHMNTNERRKMARDQYEAYSALLNALNERYQNIMMIREHYKLILTRDSFMRGLEPPYLLQRDVSSAPELHRLDFLRNHYRGTAVDMNVLGASAFNVPNIGRVLSDHDYVMTLVEKRNKEFEGSFRDKLDTYYRGNGVIAVSVDKLCDSGISYPQLTNFLRLTELTMQITDKLYHDLRQMIDELNKGCKSVLDSEIAKENSGYPTMEYNFVNDDIHYQKLSPNEQEKMARKGFNSHLDFSQKFF